MRYYSDKLFKFKLDTETKITSYENKAELAVFDAQTIVDFWEKRMVNKDKLATRSAEILKKAEIKKAKFEQQKAEYQTKRDAKYLILEEKIKAKPQKTKEA
ncbi:hypothetical protein [Spiroplasma clarkii]|uniref:Uncharacterized protein n=1 Tax=Spiroplasma clarkii TaxID=2139 RepID=A0A2K8KHB1_9MOLU|nr:hypothetical protein [Spiroplasma clarkii]ATX71067.1 hypothetical protein SCLAR_v1c07500 [Spiroplasma clarkii]